MGVPIPYPNTGLSKDTTKGTRTIRITRKEVMLKNKSYYKTSYGDEPGRAPKHRYQQDQGQGVLHLLVDSKARTWFATST